MNTREMAEAIGVQPRILRQFLRSPSSTWQSVGSGARYEFKRRDIEPLRRKFAEWKGAPKPRVPVEPIVVDDDEVTTTEAQLERDARVWAEEGPVVLPDIRDPKVRAAVRRAEAERVARLELLLMAKGMHVSQWGDRSA